MLNKHDELRKVCEVYDEAATRGQYHTCTGAPVPPLNAFSALHLLRNYNQLLLPADISQRYRQLVTQSCIADEYKLQAPAPSAQLSPVGINVTGHTSGYPLTGPAPSFLTSHPLLGYQPVAPLFNRESPLSPVLGRSLVSSTSPRRQRGEKKPIPDEQKDDKYFERRRRNNQAAKKSRDARKMREDQIAFRATMLEHENAILRAQILTLREEATSLRQMLIAKKTDQPPDHQINCR
ncbi:uncharacterized protein CBL_07842 [Carabus blaptoides fortunei]